MSSKGIANAVFGEQDYPEDIRLKYRFLDLRRDEMHENIILRSEVISTISRNDKNGISEYQTPYTFSPGLEIFLFQVD